MAKHRESYVGVKGRAINTLIKIYKDRPLLP